MEYSGEYGGKVKREFKASGTKFIAGATLTPELVSSWPLANRIALHKSGNVDWYGPPSETEQEVRVAGKPAPERGVTAPAPKQAVQTNSRPARGAVATPTQTRANRQRSTATK